MNASKTNSLLVTMACSLCVTAAVAADEFVPAPALTRAEVLADLEVWQVAGMPAFVQGDNVDGNMVSAEYQAALAKYQQMLHSPEFAQRVARIARQRGEHIDIASTTD